MDFLSTIIEVFLDLNEVDNGNVSRIDHIPGLDYLERKTNGDMDDVIQMRPTNLVNRRVINEPLEDPKLGECNAAAGLPGIDSFSSGKVLKPVYPKNIVESKIRKLLNR